MAKKQHIFNTFQNGPDTVQYTCFEKRKQERGAKENK